MKCSSYSLSTLLQQYSHFPTLGWIKNVMETRAQKQIWVTCLHACHARRSFLKHCRLYGDCLRNFALRTQNYFQTPTENKTEKMTLHWSLQNIVIDNIQPLCKMSTCTPTTIPFKLSGIAVRVFQAHTCPWPLTLQPLFCMATTCRELRMAGALANAIQSCCHDYNQQILCVHYNTFFAPKVQMPHCIP